MNIAVAQSGGPTCAINASLVGVYRQALQLPQIDTVFGSINGIEGILKDDLIILGSAISTNEDMELLRQTPSTVLGSCRYKLPDSETDEAPYKAVINTFDRHRIKKFIYIGGNDSMDTVVKLSDYFRKVGREDISVIGVPKTIDNDLCVTDHTPGFGSAAKYVASTVQEIVRDSRVYSIDSVTIIEIMGRNAGWLTASTCMLRANGEIAPHLIYLPEAPFSVSSFIEDVRCQQAKHKAVIVAVSEGVTLDESDPDIPQIASGIKDDAFGHSNNSGIGKKLEIILSKALSCKIRSIELSVMQRCSSHICSKTDIDEAERIGAGGLLAAMNGESGKMMYFKRISSMPYVITVESIDAKEVANKEKLFPRAWITEGGNNVSDDAVKYFLPLIQGEVKTAIKNGMPLHFTLK